MASSRKRPNVKRDNIRLLEHLKLRCYICYDRKARPMGEGRDMEEHRDETSIPVPCCGKYIHESCLANCFYNCQNGPTCPFCRARLIPLNINEVAPADSRGTVVRFRQVPYEHGRNGNTSFRQLFQGEAANVAPHLDLVPMGSRAAMGFDDSPQVRMIPPEGWSETMRAAASRNGPHPPSRMSWRARPG